MIEEEPVIEEPVFIPHDPLFKPGDVLLRKENGTYLLISELLPDNQYRIEELIRRNDGYFVVQPGLARNGSMQEYELLYQKTAELPVPADSVFKPATPYQARSTTTSAAGKKPLYVRGDLISRSSGSSQEVIPVLGCESAPTKILIAHLSPSADIQCYA